LLEGMISSIIICLVLFAVSWYGIEAERHFIHTEELAVLEAEVRAFIVYAEEEIRRCDRFEKWSDKVVFIDRNGVEITYQKIGDRVSRRVNGEGYIIILQYVDALTFEVKPEGCQFHIRLKNGTARWEGSVFIGKRVERDSAK
jgi:hypothetical protein